MSRANIAVLVAGAVMLVVGLGFTITSANRLAEANTYFATAQVMMADAADIADMLATAQSQEELYPDVVEATATSVVHIASFLDGLPVDNGSGVIYTSDGFIVTNAHVVGYGRVDNVVVTLTNVDEVYEDVEIVGIAACDDVAVLKLDAEIDVPPVEKQLPLEARIGEPVIAIGYPRDGLLNAELPVANDGRISQLGVAVPPYENLIQHEASVNPGQSGGGLFTHSGEFIGLNTLRIEDAQEISFAISVEHLDTVYEYLSRQQAPQNDLFEIGTHQGTFEQRLDRHCWSFEVTAGDDIVVNVTAQEPNVFDPELWLYGPTNLLVGFNADLDGTNTRASRVRFTPQLSGVFTVMVARDSRDSTTLHPIGDYQLALSQPSETEQ